MMAYESQEYSDIGQFMLKSFARKQENCLNYRKNK